MKGGRGIKKVFQLVTLTFELHYLCNMIVN